MPNSFFKFKRFTVWHDQCAMKVGTDGVLLGSWVRTDGVGRLLDVGTGTGLIALMLAQRSRAVIDAIDLDADACRQAEGNVLASPFADRIQIHPLSLHAYAAESAGGYDLIVSNPPYFNRSLKCANEQRTLARHNDSLHLDSLLADCCRLLAPAGRIALVLPSDQEKELLIRAAENRLLVVRRTDVLPTPTSLPKRLLVELSSASLLIAPFTRLVLEVARHQYTADYKDLTKDYYLD